MKSRIPVIILAGLSALPLFATNGYFMHGQGSANKAMAGAGVAIPQDPIDVANNPAAVSLLPKGYYAGLALFSPDRQYTVTGTPSGYPGTFPLVPGTYVSESELFPIPSLAANFRLSETSAWNLAMLAQGGMNTDYRTATFYGDDHTGVNLSQMFITATYARTFAKKHSFGLTAVAAIQQFEASGLESFAPFSSDAESLTGNGEEYSYGATAKVGYLGQFTDALSFGASYNPKINMSEFDSYQGLFAEQGGFDIPSQVTAGFAYRFSPKFLAALDYQRIHFSDVASVGNPMLPNMMMAPLGANVGAGFGWEDVDTIKFGVQYSPNAEWALRAGYSKADNPIPTAEVMFNILAPGVIEEHVTAGFSKNLKNTNGRINLAIMYALENSVTGGNPLEAPGAQSITLTMDEWEAEISYTFGF